MKYTDIKESCLAANHAIVEAGLVLLTWGNVSVVDRNAGVFAIKPSGVDYATLSPRDIVVLDIATGETVDGTLRPSTDTPTHRYLYQHFESIGSVIHTHSHFAVACAQAARSIPCLGTTHADFFLGTIPVTEPLSKAEIEDDYEVATGRSIVKAFSDNAIDPATVPGVLAVYHGPFAWGKDADAAVHSAIVLEEVARLAVDMGLLKDGALQGLPEHMLRKHYERKYGPNAYYGQP